MFVFAMFSIIDITPADFDAPPHPRRCTARL